MNKCPKCEVVLKTNHHICPLCHNKIDFKEKNSIYPQIKSNHKYRNLMIISLFISLCGIIFSLLINYWVNNQIS